MNPRAVQGERDLSGASIMDQEDDGEYEGVSNTLVESSTKETQTDHFLISDAAGQLQMSIDTPLASNIELAQFVSQIVNIYETLIELSDGNIPFAPAESRIAFVDAYRNPLIVCNRTKITPTAERIATLSDALFDFRRCFLFFVDFLKRFDDFTALSFEDQIVLAKRRFSPFQWWLVSNWSAQCNCPGVCYSNGAYYPVDKTQQFCQDLRGSVEVMCNTLVEPLQEIQLDIGERCMVFAILLFASEFSDLSPATQFYSKQMRDKYIRALYNHVSHRDITKTDAETAYRIFRIMLLISAIANLTFLANDNYHLNDVLHIVDYGKWSEEIREGCNQFCRK